MLAIGAGTYFESFDRGRGFVPNTNDSGRAIDVSDLVEPRPVEPTHSTRLVYDHDMKRSYVEFLDDKSGRVIDRFPAEQLRDAIMARDIADRAAKAKLLDVVV